jgi:putative ABC transport system permease protein
VEIRPILSALLRHKTDAALIVLEIALSCAIVCNAVFIIGSRVQHMHRASGIAEDELVDVQVSSLSPDADQDALRRADIAALSAIAGVKAVSSVNEIPYGGNVWITGASLAAGQPEPTLTPTQYMDDGQLLPTLGLRVVEGRAFTSDEYRDDSEMKGPDAVAASMLVTRSVARKLFPGGNALGKDVYIADAAPTRIVGIIENVVAPGGSHNDPSKDYDAIVLPLRVSNGEYVLRTDPARRAEVLAAAVETLGRVDPNRLFGDAKTLQEMRHEFYSRDRSVVWLLVAVCIALLAVTALGIVGLASFWVQQRTKQIGVRRALGATRGQILRHFQAENFILTTVGIVFGLLLAYGINQMLMGKYELPRLPGTYLPVAAVLLWVLGQLAVLGPARRAARVPPAVATRTV